MNDYREVRIVIEPYSDDAADLLSALLADIGYESFMPGDGGLKAWIPADDFDPHGLKALLEGFPMNVRLEADNVLVEGRDWNEEWEKNYFQPIVVADRCVIHSTFHKNVPKVRYDIVIDPKMAFGTGHHSTTALIIGYLLDMPLEGKTIIDMGTGTGILAILCMMRGAGKAVGIEIDRGAYENALENVAMNHVEVELVCGDASALAGALPDGGAELLIANINRNIVLADMDSYVSALKPGGKMILSGFYTQDVPLVERRAAMLGMCLVEQREDNGWAAVMLECEK